MRTGFFVINIWKKDVDLKQLDADQLKSYTDVGLWECVARNNPQASKSGAVDPDIILRHQMHIQKTKNL